MLRSNRPTSPDRLPIARLGLGGHWRGQNGERFCDRFAGDEVPPAIIENRIGLLDVCQELGVNYIDLTTPAECQTYGLALEGRRDRFILGADNYAWSLRDLDEITPQRLIANVEQCLQWLRTDYLDLWRCVTDVRGRNTAKHVDAVVSAAEQLKQAGKIRWFGISAHDRAWLERTLGGRPEIEVVLFPCTPLTRLADRTDDPWPKAGSEGLLETARRSNTQIIAIKPFAGGTLFDRRCADPLNGNGLDSDTLARFTLRRIFEACPSIDCVVPGCTTVAELRNAWRALNEPVDATRSRQEQFTRYISQQMGNLPADYAWLRQWDVL